MSEVKVNKISPVADNSTLTIGDSGDTVTISGLSLAVNSVDSDQYVDGSIDNAHLAANSVDSDNYVDGSIDEAHIANDAINFATHLKAGTDGELITWDASGNPAAVAVGTSTHVLTSGGAGVAPTFQAAAGGGKILQVLSSTKTDTFSTSATAFTDTGLEVTITPASGTKVLVMVNCNYSMAEGLEASGRLIRDSTPIAIGDAASSRPVGTFNMNRHHAYSDGAKWNSEAGMTYLDTHGADGSTAVIYKLQYSAIASSTIYMNRTVGDANDLSGTRAVSTITVMEVGS